MYARPVKEYCAAPMMTSEKPSPFTSPAVETDAPNLLLAASPVSVVAGVADVPAADPGKRYARPGLFPAPGPGAPTMMSEKPSRFTSPAVPTENPNSLLADPVRIAAAVVA